MRPHVNPRAGFTLVELLVASTLAAILMAAVLSTYLYIGRNLSRLASFQALETESHRALAYLTRDFVLAESVKTGTTPTAATVTLVLPAGEVTYSYDSPGRYLRRQATFGVSPDLRFLHNDSCECTLLTISYFTATDGAPTNQNAPTTNVPYSIRRIQVSYVVESPSTWSALTRTRYETVSARYSFRNRGAPNGT